MIVLGAVPLGILLLVGISWGALPLFSDGTVFYNERPAHPIQLLLLWAVAGAFLWWILPTFHLVLIGSFTLMLGGATSNLLYRMLLGPVPDYIPLPFGAWGNVADMFIFLGAPLFIFFLLRQYLLSRRRTSSL